jgi:hypothetical protein
MIISVSVRHAKMRNLKWAKWTAESSKARGQLVLIVPFDGQCSQNSAISSISNAILSTKSESWTVTLHDE